MFAIRLYLEMDKCPSLIPVYLLAIDVLKKFINEKKNSIWLLFLQIILQFSYKKKNTTIKVKGVLHLSNTKTII